MWRLFNPSHHSTQFQMFGVIFLFLFVTRIHVFQRKYDIWVASVPFKWTNVHPQTQTNTDSMYLWLLEHIKWLDFRSLLANTTCWMLCNSITSLWFFSGSCNLLEKKIGLINFWAVWPSCCNHLPIQNCLLLELCYPVKYYQSSLLI